MKVWTRQKSDKRCKNNVCRFFGRTLFIQVFMHFREKSVAITVFGVLDHPTRTAPMNKIVHSS